MSNTLSIYTIYGPNTKDYPGEYVCRRHEVTPGRSEPKELVCRGKTLKEVRQQLPQGMTKLERHPQDDHTIIESWL